MTVGQSQGSAQAAGWNGSMSDPVRYRTIVVDPPWHYKSWPGVMGPNSAWKPDGALDNRRKAIDYPTMAVDEIRALPVGDLSADDAHLYLWTTNRYLFDAFAVVRAWGFRYSQTLVWAKTPCGLGPGGAYAQNAEFVLFARRGALAPLRRHPTVWWNFKRQGKGMHSRKPDAFLDVVEQVSPGPYAELFARRARFGWDYPIGDESLGGVAA